MPEEPSPDEADERVDPLAPAPDLAAAVGAAGGLTAVVGAGGKKSLLYRLAGTLDRAVLTTTVRIPVFDDRVGAVRASADPVAALGDAGGFPLGLVRRREREDRYEGYDPATVDRLAGAHDGPTLVKADGARTRWLKAPAEHEPRIPGSATTVVPVASARVVGEPLSPAHVHRPERVAAVTDATPGDPVEPRHVATVLTHPAGALKGVPPDATVLPVLNMVDDPALRDTAETIAREVRERAPEAIDRVLLTRLVADDPVVDAVE